MATSSQIDQTSVLDGHGDLPNAADQVQVAGYTLVERIGAGGYGEVWKAIGPGGLPKAVKMLYGRLDGQQAEVELKSLERVRELRHPFLLNIERIEVCDGRLIVVSELADCCMEKRFAAATQDGLKGIPRDELLGYLRDAADALDFMSKRGGLQHLDIKPANLLLQGEHAKVGDFGLTKDISSTAVSIMGGFTPLYSSPEIFEGRPSHTSDQYSLAIVYQTMLTGVPPFAGRTAAQLTAQHLSSTPDLLALQPVDRPVIARALSKNAQARFESCRELVDALSKRRHATSRAQRSAASCQSLPASIKSTRVVSAGTMATASEQTALETKPLNATPADATKVSYRPTVFIAVGGLGGRVLQSLKERFEAEFGQAELPAFPMLYLDTDARSLDAMRSRSEVAGLNESELVHFPLRSSREFRSEENRPLNWLSRRWLFNIPRSGQVEGLRPLGRLALVDQQEQVRRRLSEVIAKAVADESLAATRKATHLPVVSGPADVFVIASSCGGTGSGSALDMGYLVKDVCASLQMKPATVSGVLLHATSVLRQASDVQEAGTICLLRELLHFSTPGLGGPRGLNQHPPANQTAPFDLTYFVHMGDGLNDTDFSEQTRNVSDYLFANVATQGRVDLDSWRKKEQADAEQAPTSIRTFGMASTDEAAFRVVQNEAWNLCRALTAKWAQAGASEPIGRSTGDETQTAETLTVLGELSLTGDLLVAKAMQAASSEGGRALSAYARQRCELVKEQSSTGQAKDHVTDPASLLTRMARTLAEKPDDGSSDQESLSSIAGLILSQALPSVDDIIESLAAHLTLLLDQPRRFRGAEAALGEILNELNTAAQACERTLDEIANDIQLTCREASPEPREDSGMPATLDVTAFKEKMARLCLQCSLHAIYQAVRTHIAQVRKRLADVGSQLLNLRASVARVSQQFTTEKDSANIPATSVLESFDKYLLSNDQFQLADLLETGDEPMACCALYECAIAYKLANSTLGSEPSPRNLLADFPAIAHPVLSNVGGGRRVLAFVPDSAPEDYWRRKLVDEFGDCITLRKTAGTVVSVCCEVEGFEISQVLAQFLRHNPQLAEVAGRIHTRNDIDW